jgi:hypothetical protein
MVPEISINLSKEDRVMEPSKVQERQASLVVVFVCLLLWTSIASAQTKPFGFQGSINDGGRPANGKYDFQFALWDSLSGGKQIGSTQTISPVTVNNGTYTVQLDFGAAAFVGKDRFLEVATRRSGTAKPFAPQGPPRFAVNGSDPVAVILATNSQPGITNPSPASLPPAAVRGDTTSGINSTFGLLGISDGAANAGGVLGIGRGTPSGGDVNGVVGIATSTTGKTKGVTGNVSSPDGIAIQASAANGGRLFVGSNDSDGDVFQVSNLGRVTGRSFFNQDQSFGADRFGNIRANGINVGPANGGADSFVVQPDGTVSATGLHIGQNISQNNDTFTVNSPGVVGVNGSFTVTGTKSAIARLPDGRSVLLYAMESPENWFEDFGTVRLRHGVAWVAIDKTFSETVNTSVGYHIFLTPNGNCRGLYIARKISSGFEVRELGRGRSNIAFDYRIVAQRKGYEKTRFAEAPSLQNANTKASARQ